MMKQFAILYFIILLFCGCTAGGDTTWRSDGEITFELARQAYTRGSVIDGTAIPVSESFRVYAWLSEGGATTAFMTRDVTDPESNVVSGVTGKWVPKQRYYWPENPEAAISFYAVYPKDCSLTRTDAGDVSFPFTIGANVSSQSDLMTAKAENVLKSSTANGAASLAFRHLLSQVSFSALLSTDFAGWQVSVTGIRICHVNSQGTYHYSGSIVPATPAVPVDYNLVMAADAVTVSSTSEPVALTSATDVALLMPQSLTAWDRATETASSTTPLTDGCYLAIACTITDPVGRVAFTGSTYLPFGPTWASAQHYAYTLQFGSGYSASGNPSVTDILLTCSVAPWVDPYAGGSAPSEFNQEKEI